MFKKVLSFIVTGVVAVMLSLGVAAPAHAQEMPAPVTFRSSVSVRVDNVSYKELYTFLTDIRNDSKWYPGIIDTTIIQSGPGNRLVGTVYQQQASVNGMITNTKITVLGTLKYRLHLIKGEGDIANYVALYTFTKASNGGGVFTLNSEYTVPGLTEDQFRQYITYCLGNLLTYYNSPGAVWVNYLEVVD